MLFKDKFLTFIKSKFSFYLFPLIVYAFCTYTRSLPNFYMSSLIKRITLFFFFAKPREKLSRLQNFLEIHFYVNILKMPLTNKINLSELF